MVCISSGGVETPASCVSVRHCYIAVAYTPLLLQASTYCRCTIAYRRGHTLSRGDTDARMYVKQFAQFLAVCSTVNTQS